MAIISKIYDFIAKPIKQIHTPASMMNQDAVGALNYAWRARILLNRATSLKIPHVVRPDEVDPVNLNTSITQVKANIRRAMLKIPKPFLLDTPTISTVRNSIVIINPNTKTGTEGKSYESLVIQGKPSEVNCEAENSWVAVRTNGRNNPFYMYTGSEDTISFDISWYSIEPDRSDVIKKCRLLESWTKADAYGAAPPELWLSWGSSELFKHSNFILVSAPYVLSNFQNAYRLNRSSPIIDLGLMPNTATQKLTFKRVTDHNLSRVEIQRFKDKATPNLEPKPIEVKKIGIPERVEIPNQP